MITSIVSPKYQGPPFHPDANRLVIGERVDELLAPWRRRGSQDSYPGTKSPIALD